jgi:hypothetical protein
MNIYSLRGLNLSIFIPLRFIRPDIQEKLHFSVLPIICQEVFTARHLIFLFTTLLYLILILY